MSARLAYIDKYRCYVSVIGVRRLGSVHVHGYVNGEMFANGVFNTVYKKVIHIIRIQKYP